MSFIINSRGEKVLRDRLHEITAHDDTIMVISEEGKGFPLSRFLFNFFSNIILPREVDVVLTPLPSDNLDSAIQTISFEGLQIEEHPLPDIVMDIDTICRNTTLTPMKKQSEFRLSDQSLTTIKSLSSESLEIKSEALQALGPVDNKNTTEKKDKEKFKKGKHTNYAIERIGNKCGPHLVGPKKGNPKIEWDFKDGEKYVKTIMCQVCGKLFDHEKYARMNSFYESYSKHYRQHELETTDCGCDNIQFKSDLERNKHWKNVHEGHLICKICSNTFTSEASLKLHTENVHQERMCDQCNFKTSKGSYYLKVHIRTAHEKKEENAASFNCNQDDCEKTFKSKCLLNAHVNKVHVISTCHLCNKQVKRLDQHFQINHSEKKYQCDKCAKAFRIMAKLEEHEKVDHQGLRYFCRYSDCRTKEQEYRDYSNRSAHERKRHGAVFKSH